MDDAYFDNSSDSSLEDLCCIDTLLFHPVNDPSTDNLVTADYSEREHEQKSTHGCLKSIYPKWAELPSLALENIYLCLHRKDRCRMSAVCRNWFQEYTNNATLLKSAIFQTPHCEGSAEIKQHVLYINKYGHMLNHVVIDCSKLEMNVSGQPLKILFDALSKNTQLLSLSFMYLRLYLNVLDPGHHEEYFESILDLLLSQTKLKSIEFWKAKLEIPKAETVFRLISITHFATLKSLKLDRFVCDTFPHNLSAHSMDALATYNLLMNLKEMAIDYSEMFEKIIMACVECANSGYEHRRKGALKSMKLYCNCADNTLYKGIPPSVWKCFTQICPAFKIDVILYLLCMQSMVNTINKFIVLNMPIKSFKFENYCPTFYDEGVDIGSVLRHLVSCKINLGLEDLNITLIEPYEIFATELVYLLQACPQLRKVKLCLLHPVHYLNTVFNFWLENKAIHLKFVHITVKGVQKQHKSHYVNLSDKYFPLLKLHGVKLRLEIKRF